MKNLIIVLIVLSFCSCNRFWNTIVDGEANREVFRDDDRKTIVMTYPSDSTSKIKVKEHSFGK